MANRPTLALGALVVLLAVIAAGCGSSSSSSSGPTTTTSANTTTTTTTNGGNRGQALAAFQTCLASHGVKLSGGFGQPPNGQSGSGPPPQGQPPSGQNRPAFNSKQQKAFAACRSKLPAGARGGFGQGGRPPTGQSNPAFARYTRCLRQHGVTFGATNNQAAFKKASAACAKYAPTPSGGTGGGS